jgi:hypothetical protein
LHQNPRPGAAVLARVVERGVRRRRGGAFEIGVGEDSSRPAKRTVSTIVSSTGLITSKAVVVMTHS